MCLSHFRHVSARLHFTVIVKGSVFKVLQGLHRVQVVQNFIHKFLLMFLCIIENSL